MVRRTISNRNEDHDYGLQPFNQDGRRLCRRNRVADPHDHPPGM